MKLPELIVVAKAQLSELQERSRLWWMGWAFAGLSFVVAGAVLAVGALLLGDLRQLQDRQDDILVRAVQVQQAQEKSWNEQHEAIKTITLWGQYVKERFDLADLDTHGSALPTPAKKPPLTFGNASSKEKP